MSVAVLENAMDVAVVTGASSGIGFEFCKLLAADDIALIMVGNAGEEQLLQQKQAELQQQYSNVNVLGHIAVDLAKPEGAEALFRDVKTIYSEPISHLFNNAGFGDHKLFIESDLQRQNQMMQLNMLTPVNLMHLFLPEMIKANRGYILNTVSIAGFLPLPHMSVYSSTKSFLRNFTRAVQSEIKNTNIVITALHPGATATNFIATAEADNAAGLSFYKPSSPENVAKLGYEGLKQEKRFVIPGLINKLVAGLGAYFPVPSLVVGIAKKVIG